MKKKKKKKAPLPAGKGKREKKRGESFFLFSALVLSATLPATCARKIVGVSTSKKKGHL